MGKLRARSESEILERKKEIWDAASDLLLEQDYESITLATIAEKTTISRPSMYHYYETKEDVCVDLMIQEYQKWEETLRQTFAERMTREEFCRGMVDLLWERPLLLKLLSLHISTLRSKCSEEMLYRFEQEIRPFYHTLADILNLVFPESSDTSRDMFRIQFTVYCNSLYPMEHIPDSQLQAIKDLNVLGNVPSPKEICYKGLMLLGAEL